MSLPPGFDPAVYRSLHRDLKSMTLPQATQHYLKHGRLEGRDYMPENIHLTLEESIDRALLKHSVASPGRYKSIVVPRVCPQRKACINILFPGYARTLTGGPISILRVAETMVREGIPVRIVDVSGGGIPSQDIKAVLPRYGLEFLCSNGVEWTEASDSIKYSKKDMFMATYYTTAFKAHELQKQLNKKPFLYMIQDCEAFFGRHDSEAARVYSTYSLQPHVPIFNSWILRDYFIKVLGYKSGNGGNSGNGGHGGKIFDYFPQFPPWIKIPTTTKTTKRLIVYARPQIDRNAYDFTVQCLDEAARQGLFPPHEWTIFGVGASRGTPNVTDLGGKGVTLCILDHIYEDLYHELLQSGDIGLCLMMSPHPSLPPFDMASRGMLVVTNTLFTRTEEEYRNISPNIFPAPTSIPAVVDQLRAALHRVDDTKAREKGAVLNIPEHSIDYSWIRQILLDEQIF